MTDAHPERLAGYDLIESGTLVTFEVQETDVRESADGDETLVRIELQLGLPNEDEEDDGPTDDHEWGAFGFIFTLAVLSFKDARPRGGSVLDFVEEDEFTVRDLLQGLRYERGELRFSADYVRGRCMKTDVTVRPTGAVTLETHYRGETALRWVDRLKGKTSLKAVDED